MSKITEKIKNLHGKVTPLANKLSGKTKVLHQKVKVYTRENKKISLIILVVVLIVLIGGIYLWKKHSDKVRIENQEIALKNIFALGHLPVDEDPASSTVKDLEAVKNSPFFKDAQLGDIILFFKKARMAGILRPSTGKIINSALVVGEIPSQFKALGGENPEDQTVNVAVFNATKITGFADKESKLLSDAFKSDVNIVYKDSARHNDMKITTVVDLSGENAGLANALSVVLGGVKGDFPPGEKLPGAMKDFPEILIFLGSSSVK